MSAKKRSKTKKWVTTSIIMIAVVGIAAYFLMRPAHTSYVVCGQ